MELVITSTAETDRRNMIKSVLTYGGKIFNKSHRWAYVDIT